MNQTPFALTTCHQTIVRHIQVNIPFTMLISDSWLDFFISAGLNPEIGLDAAALDGFSLSMFKKIAEIFHHHGRSITLHGPFMDLSPGSPDPKIRDLTRRRFDQLIEAAAIFHPKTVVCHCGYDKGRYGFCRELWTGLCIDLWKWLGKELYQIGARLMLENVYESNPGELTALLDHLDWTHTGCCLDVGHQSVYGSVPLAEWLAAVGPRIGQMHLHDNHGDRDSHLGMGKGRIQFSSLFEFLRNRAEFPVITLEPHEREDLLSSLNYLEQFDFASLLPRGEAV